MSFLGLVIAIGLGVALAPLILRLSLGLVAIGALVGFLALCFAGIWGAFYLAMPDDPRGALIVAGSICGAGVALWAVSLLFNPPKPAPRAPWKPEEKPYISPYQRARMESRDRDAQAQQAQQAQDAAILQRALARYDKKQNSGK